MASSSAPTGGQSGAQAVTERRYRATRAGAAMWERSHSFYEDVRLGIADRRWSDA